MVIAGTSYPTPIYSLNAVTVSTVGATIDCGSCTLAMVPPVMVITVTGNVSVSIEGSHDGINFSACPTPLTASDMIDLIIGVRFWRANATIVAGSVTAVVGAVPNHDGHLVMPNLYSVTNNPGAGA